MLGIGRVPAQVPSVAAKPPTLHTSSQVEQLLRKACLMQAEQKLPEALKSLDAAQEIAESQQDVRAQARTLAIRAEVYIALQRRSDAQNALSHELAIYAASGDTAGQIKALGDQAILESWLPSERLHGLEDEASALAKQERVQPARAARALAVVGLRLYVTDRYAEARAVLRQAADLLHDRDPASVDYADCLLALAIRNINDVLFSADRLIRARTEEDVHAAQAIYDADSSQAEASAWCSFLLAGLALTRADTDGAEVYAQRGLERLELYPGNAAAVAPGLLMLTGIYMVRGDAATARALYRRARPALEQAARENRNLRATIDLLDVALTHDPATTHATPQLPTGPEAALGMTRETVRAVMEAAQAEVEWEHRRLDEARQHADRARQMLMEAAPGSLTEADTLSNLARVLLAQGQCRAAAHYAKQAWDTVLAASRTIAGDAAMREFDHYFASIADTLLACQLAAGNLQGAFRTTEQSHSHYLLSLTSERRLLAAPSRTSQWKAYDIARKLEARHNADLAHAAGAYAASRSDLARVFALYAQGNAARPQAHSAQARMEAARSHYVRTRAASTLARSEAERRWRDVLETLPPLVAAPTISLRKARDTLPAGSLYVSFTLGNERAYLLMMAPDGALRAWTLQASPAELQARTERYRKLIADGRAMPWETYAEGKALWHALFPPPALSLLAGARRLVIAPDGPLWDVAFATLPLDLPSAAASIRIGGLHRSMHVARGGAMPDRDRLGLARGNSAVPLYLGLAKPITYVTSLTWLAALRQRTPPPDANKSLRAFVAGDPALPSASAGALFASTAGDVIDSPAPRLPEAAAEAREIAHMYRVAPVLGAQVTEPAVRAGIATADIVHLAAHCIYLQDSPMGSSIRLARAQRAAVSRPTDNDGLLQAWEVLDQMKLRARLVVLSGCETARGEPLHGAGAAGFTEAMEAAGARSVVGSLTPVDSGTTQSLMVSFHRFLRRGLSKDEALQHAMRAVAQGDRRTAAPHYWGTFFLAGDPSPLFARER